MAGDVKEYLVNYIVNSQGNAPDLFKKLAEQASNAQKAISESVKNIQTITGQLTTAFNNSKEAWNITPTVNNKNALDQLANLERKVEEASLRMRKNIASALNGTLPNAKNGDTIAGALGNAEDRLKSYKRKLAALNTQQVELQRQFMLKGGSQAQNIKKAVDQLWAKEDINSKVLPKISKLPEAQSILKDIKSQIDARNSLSNEITNLEKQLQTAPKPQITPASAARQGYEASNVVEINDLTKKIEEQKKIYEAAQKKLEDLKDPQKLEEELQASKQRAMYKYGMQSGGIYPKWETVFGNEDEIAKLPKFLQTIVTEAGNENAIFEEAKKQATTASDTLKSLQQQLERVKRISGEKPVTIIATLNTAPAIEKANELIKAIGTRSVTIPITFGNIGEKPSSMAAEDSISKETGRLTEAGRKLSEQTNKLMDKQKTKAVKNAKAEIPDIVKQIESTVKSLNALAGKAPIEIVTKLGTASLLPKLQETIESLRVYSKENPIVLSTKVKKASASSIGEKAISKNGKVSSISDTSVESTREKVQAKVSEKPIIFRSSFNGGDAAFQANLAQQQLQKLVGEKPIIFRSSFNGGDAAFQANLAQQRLQKLVNEKPIVFRSFFNGGDAAFEAQRSLVRLQQLVGEKPIIAKAQFTGFDKSLLSKKGKEKSILVPVKVKADKIASQLNGIISKAKASAGAKKGITITAKLSVKGVTAKLSNLLKELQAKANKNPITLKAQLNNGDTLTRLNTTIANLQKSVEKLGKVSSSAGVGKERGGSTIASGSTLGRRGMVTENYIPVSERVYGQKKPDVYARMRAALYPVTGNTSFGARTPAMMEMAQGMGTMFAVGGAMSAVGSSLSQAISYQNTMKTAQAILQNGTKDYTPGDFNTMTHTVRQVGKDTKFTAPDVANAARFMAMAGLHTKDITAAIRPVADVALIGDTDLGTTADKLTNVMTTFGLNAKQMRDIADIMTSTFTRSNTDMLMLAESAKYAGGIAHLYGKNFKNTFADTMALFGVLGNAGIQASSAGTTIRMMYQNLMQPNKNQLATLKKYNIYTRDKNGEPLEMRDILAQISAKVPQNKMADAIGQMFRITAQPGAAALASNMPMVTELIRANETAAGSGISQNIANEKKGTLAGLWAQVTSSFTEAVVQAMENRQEKWAKMLGNVRDFLSDPETIKGISAIIDLVEVLAKAMMQFAKIWAGAYIKFPKIINFWLQVQMVMTQFGYILTPLVQISGMLSNFKSVILGVGNALNITNKAAAGANIISEAGNLVGVAGGNGFSRFKNTTSLAYDRALLNASVIQNLKAREAKFTSLGAKMRSTLVRNDGTREALSPLWFATVGSLGNDPDNIENPAEMYNFMRQRNAEGHIMKRFKAAGHAEARAAEMRSKIAEAKAARLAELKNIRRPLQMADTDLIARYASMTGNSALVYEALKTQNEAKRMDVAKSIFMRGGKHASLGLKMGFQDAFKNARKFGSINAGGLITSMIGGMKSAFFGLMRGLASAVGFLTSPIGLAIAGLTALSVGIASVYKITKRRAEQQKGFEALNKRTAESYAQQRQKIIDGADQASNAIKRVNVQLSSGIKPLYSYPKQKNYLSGNKVVSTLINQNESDELSPFEISPYITSSNIVAPEVKRAINEAKYSYYSASGASYFWGQQKHASEKAKELGVIAQWANIATQQPQVIKAVKEMRDAVAKGDKNRQNAILEQFAPDKLNAVHMTGSPMSAWQLSKIQDPSKYYEWQFAQYRYLQEAQMRAGQSVNYNRAVGMVNSFDKMSAKQRSAYDATELARQLIESVPLMINNTPAAITLTKMGGVDWTTLANTVNNGVPFTLQQQQEILANTYSAILDDPNIKNVAGIGELLKVYLPKIAEAKSMYDDFILGHIDPGTNASRQGHFDKKKNNKVNVPYKASPNTIPIYHFNLNGVKWTGGSQFEKDSKNYDPTRATKMLNQRQGIGGGSSTLNKSNRAITNNRVVNHSFRPSVAGTTSSPAVTNKKNKPGSQKGYASTYDRGAARPTQVNITIENLCRFDRTSINKDADSNAIAMAIENKISEAIAMLSSSALNTAGQTISQGLA